MSSCHATSENQSDLKLRLNLIMLRLYLNEEIREIAALCYAQN